MLTLSTGRVVKSRQESNGSVFAWCEPGPEAFTPAEYAEWTAANSMPKRAQMIVSGSTPVGRRSFIKDCSGPISPMLADLVELFDWMRMNGWCLDEHGTTPEGDAGALYPWRVRKVG